MSTLALSIVLLAALLHAGWNLVAKRSGGDHHFLFLVVCLIAVLWSPLLWVWGPDELRRWQARDWSLAALSGFIHVLYFLALLKGYREADLTVVYPTARGSGPLLTAFGAAIWLDEGLGPVGVAGLLAVSAGLWLLAGAPGWRRGQLSAQETMRLRLGLLWGGLTGLTVACYTLVDGYAMRVALLSPLIYDYFANVLRLPWLAPLVWRDRHRAVGVWAAQWKLALVVAVCSPAAYILVLLAFTMAPVSHVAPAREVSMLFAALLGGHLLAERDKWLRLAGAAAMGLGVVLLASA
ncbi:MAG: EamA family transporter [Betaproteobacteria bacterium]|nr:EamA family transporter [Betaproteobacteria bacterium]